MSVDLATILQVGGTSVLSHANFVTMLLTLALYGMCLFRICKTMNRQADLRARDTWRVIMEVMRGKEITDRKQAQSLLLRLMFTYCVLMVFLNGWQATVWIDMRPPNLKDLGWRLSHIICAVMILSKFLLVEDCRDKLCIERLPTKPALKFKRSGEKS